MRSAARLCAEVPAPARRSLVGLVAFRPTTRRSQCFARWPLRQVEAPAAARRSLVAFPPPVRGSLCFVRWFLRQVEAAAPAGPESRRSRGIPAAGAGVAVLCAVVPAAGGGRCASTLESRRSRGVPAAHAEAAVLPAQAPAHTTALVRLLAAQAEHGSRGGPYTHTTAYVRWCAARQARNPRVCVGGPVYVGGARVVVPAVVLCRWRAFPQVTGGTAVPVQAGGPRVAVSVVESMSAAGSAALILPD